MAYIIDTYNRYDRWDRENSTYIFYFNEQAYAIKRVELVWGKPQLPTRICESAEIPYFIYNTEDEAKAFVQRMKSLNHTHT